MEMMRKGEIALIDNNALAPEGLGHWIPALEPFLLLSDSLEQSPMTLVTRM